MKLWGGRFSEGLDTLAARYNNSLPFDWRLSEVDVLGSIAWAKAINKAGLITDLVKRSNPGWSRKNPG